MSDIAFVTTQMRRSQMQGRRPEKTWGVLAEIQWGWFLAKNDADGCGSFASV